MLCSVKFYIWNVAIYAYVVIFQDVAAYRAKGTSDVGKKIPGRPASSKKKVEPEDDDDDEDEDDEEDEDEDDDEDDE